MAHVSRDKISQTDEQIEAIFDDQGIGLTVDDLVFVTDTISDFLAGRQVWSQPGRIVEQTDELLVIDNVQPRKGTPRRTLVVADLGPARAVYGFDR